MKSESTSIQIQIQIKKKVHISIVNEKRDVKEKLKFLFVDYFFKL